MKVYVAPEVAEVDALHPYLTDDAFRALSIRDRIAKQAETVQAAHAAGDRRCRMHVMSWWPDTGGRSLDAVMAAPLTREDARLTMSREYGFRDWEEVDALGDAAPAPSFEQALEAMLAGDSQELTARLERVPNLATARSAYGHRSTLLHYLGANGVESHRQKTPLNAVELARLLIDHGADITAEANMYGGGQTAFALASTSAHPHNAGIADDLNRILGT